MLPPASSSADGWLLKAGGSGQTTSRKGRPAWSGTSGASSGLRGLLRISGSPRYKATQPAKRQGLVRYRLANVSAMRIRSATGGWV